MSSVQSSYLGYKLVARDIEAALARKAKEPVVARQIENFRKVAPGIQSVDELFDDYSAYSFSVKASGMGELEYARALIKKVISEGMAPGSYASRLADARYIGLADAFQVVDGHAPTALVAAGNTVVERYREDIKNIAQRAVSNIEGDIVQYKAAVGEIEGYYELVKSDAALIFSLRAHGLERLLSQVDAVRETLRGGSGKIKFSGGEEEWKFDQFRLEFGMVSGKVGYQEALISKYRLEMANYEGQLKDSVDERAAAFLDKISDIKSIDDLAKTWDVISFGLQAFGLERFLFNKEDLVAALKGEDRIVRDMKPEERKIFEDFKAVFSFEKEGDAIGASLVKNIEEMVKKYLRQTLEEDLGAEDNNVRLALNFQRRAADIKSAYDILGDEALAVVIRQAFGIAPESAAADIDMQARMISSRINIEDFQDPEKVEKLITRFLLLADSEAKPAAILALFEGADQWWGGYSNSL